MSVELPRMALLAVFAAAAIPATASAEDAETGGDAATERVVHAEVDPFPFIQGGYGGQIGIRGAPFPRLRVALASFALDVPDVVTELGGNDGFHLRIRPSVGAYIFFYPSQGRRGRGFAVGGSLRYLRHRYTHDDEPDVTADVGQVSAELLAGYKWHPFAAGFFLQPWGGVALTIAERGDATVGARTYDDSPIGLFATVNLGWDLEI